MSISLKEICNTSGAEAAAVLFGLAVAVGLMGGLTESFGGNSDAILDVAAQGAAIGIFFTLTILGVVGMLFTGWKKLPNWINVALNYACPSILKVGITTGFISSAVIFGLGCGALIPFSLFGSSEQKLISCQLIVLGLFIFSIWLQFFYVAAITLKVRSKKTYLLLLLNVAILLFLSYFLGPATPSIYAILLTTIAFISFSVVLHIYFQRIKKENL